MLFGINTPTDRIANLPLLKASGANIVRQVATGRPELGNWINAYRNAGLEVLLVLAAESQQTCPDPVRWVQWYASRYAGQIVGVSCGNEPDGHHGGSSAVATHEEIDALIIRADAFRQVNPACLLIGPGLITGQPDWLDGLENLLELDAVAVHPYWKLGHELRGFLDGYHAKSYGRPIWLTEYDPRPDVARAAAAIPYVEAAIPYCWRAWSGWPLALMDENEIETPLYAEFQATVEALKMDEIARLRDEVTSLKNQQALQTLAIRRVIEGRYLGADGAAGKVVALEGGQTSVAVKFPPDASFP